MHLLVGYRDCRRGNPARSAGESPARSAGRGYPAPHPLYHHRAEAASRSGPILPLIKRSGTRNGGGATTRPSTGGVGRISGGQTSDEGPDNFGNRAASDPAIIR